ncbi:MAG: hypothetical protein JSV52_06995, partial [Candidatus Zixiibacteriota bacterium]
NQYTPLTEAIMQQAALAVALDKFIKERKISVGKKKEAKAQSGWVTYYRRGSLRDFGGSR